MTPSLPTFFIASAMMLPMVASLLAEIVPTWAIMSPVTGLENLSSSPCRARRSSSICRDYRNGLFDAALQGHRVGAGGNRLHAFAEDGLGQNGRGRGAVAGDVGSLGSDFTHHLRAHVLERILQFDFLGHGDAVLGDGRRTEFLLDDNVAALGTEGHLHCVGQKVNAAQDRLPRLLSVNNLLCHNSNLLSVS